MALNSKSPGPSRKSNGDVRMRGFTNRTTVQQAWDWIVSNSKAIQEPEELPISQSAGRVLHADVKSEIDVPMFRRAMMDGYAIQAGDTLGATNYNQLRLRVIGESLPGGPFDGEIRPNQAVRIMTGAPVPEGSDAVLPVELTSKDEGDDDVVFAVGSVAPKKNVGTPGEDIRQGTTILRAGRRLRPQDIGLLSSVGVGQVAVRRKPLVNLIVTGNELLPPGSMPTGVRIADSNSPMLQALVERDGAKFASRGIVEDRPEAILHALQDDADIVLVSGGSSVGQEDHAPRIVQEQGELAIHGIAIRPSSPAGMGVLGDKLVFLLPGNPVSCLCAYDFFAARAIRVAAGLAIDWPYRSKQLKLQRKLVSVVGRTDYARVAISDDRVEPIAISGASVLSSTTRADGFVVVPADSEGFGDGETVEVFFYD